MKKQLIILLAVTLAGFSSCKKYLDTVPDNVLKLDDVFKSRDNVVRYLNNVYSALPNEWAQRFAGFDGDNTNGGLWTAASDEAKYKYSFSRTNLINLSAFSPADDFVSKYWRAYYKPIRQATDFINKIDAATTDVTAAEKKQWKGEAKALRAFYYYQLMRIYGPVVLLNDQLIAPDADSTQYLLPRSPFDACVDYVTKEFDAAYNDLPATSVYAGQWNKGAVKAYKAQVLMLAASPLFNGNADYASMKNADGTQLISQTYDVNKWTKAVTALRDFLTEFGSTYNLYTVNDPDPYVAAYKSCRDVMTDEWNKEWIFGRTSAGNDLMAYDRIPQHAINGIDQANKGAGTQGVTQRMVDAYFMRNGRPITDPASNYTTGGFTSFKAPHDNAARSTYNEWVNREPRFYVGVTYNNSRWLYPLNFSSNWITNFEKSGNSGLLVNSSDITPTGYVVRKAVLTRGQTKAIVYLRLAQIYLDLAEALNESSPNDPDVLRYLNLVRQRAGIPVYGSGANDVPVPSGAAAMRDAIRRERQVELAFECVRYFDTRRWKIAEQTDAGPFTAMNLDGDGAAFYNKVILETRIFRKRDYLFPIPLDEMLRNSKLVQNTGW